MVIGSTISHYRIVEKLGEGGMGVVYKAEDTKLNRQVALKFLAQHLLDDQEAKDRFLREAQAAAALHHANVCPVYEIDEVEGRTFLAMAFLEGQPLEDRIAEGPLALKDALDIARQVAVGLDAAHEKGIVHRDIKPANIMVDAKGHATIMDFGLARLTEASRLTKVDTAMGTVAYMSPEQAQGMEVDGRTDIWALGCVLYEMVLGQRPFTGEYDQALLYEIVHEEVAPLTSIRAGVPMELEFIVGKCLAKGADDRYGTAQEAAKDLRTLAEKLKSGRSTILRTEQMSPSLPTMTTAGQMTNPTGLQPGAVVMSRQAQRALQALAAVATVVSLALAYAALTAPETQKPIRRLALTTSAVPHGPSISPDGRHIAYLTGNRFEQTLWVQDLDDKEPRAIVGPASFASISLAWSPDSRFIAFKLRNELKRAPVSGGPAVTVCELLGQPFGITWTPDGNSIVFTLNRQLHRVSAGGGSPEVWLEPREPASIARNAVFLPAGGMEKLLYEEEDPTDNSQIITFDRASGERQMLVAGARPVYDTSGHVIYRRDGAAGLWAIPFSIDTMTSVGEPFLVAEDAGRFSVARDGTLVYVEDTPSRSDRLVWLDREGRLLGTVGQPQTRIQYPALSPDGRRVAAQGMESGPGDIWIHEVDRPVKTRLTTDGATDLWPIWSPAGDRLAFSSGRTGGRDLYVKQADGSGTSRPLLLTADTAEWLTDWSRDGQILLLFRRLAAAGGGSGDIFYLRRQDDGNYEETPFLTTQFEEATPQFSPDERFIAYVSDESGEREIYVQAFPEGGSKRRVSVNGGVAPRWRADGKELFYVEGQTLMATPISTTPSLIVGSPDVLFSSPRLEASLGGNYLGYDVTPAGDRFVLPEAVEVDSELQPVIHVVQNWYEEFRDREE